MNLFAYLFPGILFFSFSLILNTILRRVLHLDRAHSLLAALTISPLFLALVLFYLFLFIPGQPKEFYISIISLCIFPVFLFCIKTLREDMSWVKASLGKLFHIKYTFNERVLIGLLTFVFLLCGLRIFFWPINWDDEIYYIEQSYAIGQERSMETFQNWGVFDNGVLNHQMNPSIRPGLPLVYSYVTLFSTTLNFSVGFAKIITFYYFSVFIGLVIFLSRKISKGYIESTLITLLLIFTTYLFVNLAVLGFKEMLIICLLLLSMDMMVHLRQRTNVPLIIYLGVILGLMTFINYSGSLLAIISVPLIYYSNKSGPIKSIGYIMLIGLVTLILGGFEFLYSVNLAVDGGFAKITLKNQIQLVSTVIENAISYTKRPIPKINLDTTGISQNNTGASEYKSYGIDSKITIYTRGKLQGLFQFQYFGLGFFLFLLTLLFRVKPLLSNVLTKTVLVFVGLYYLLFIDIFMINPSQFASVLTVSHKYTALIIPFIALITGSQWLWWKKVFSYIDLKFTLAISGFVFLGGLFYVDYHYPEILKLVMSIVPSHQPNAYYFGVLRMANTSLIILTATFISLFVVSYIFINRQVFDWWKRYKMGSILIFVVMFYLPFLFFFNTNFGIKETLSLSFSPESIKLANIKGWNGLYLMVNYLNTLPSESKILFVNGNISQIKIHLASPSKNLAYLGVRERDFWSIFTKKNYKSFDYILFPTNFMEFDNRTPIYSTDLYKLYRNDFF